MVRFAFLKFLLKFCLFGKSDSNKFQYLEPLLVMPKENYFSIGYGVDGSLAWHVPDSTNYLLNIGNVAAEIFFPTLLHRGNLP